LTLGSRRPDKNKDSEQDTSPAGDEDVISVHVDLL
jgi:hypothetical protein